MAFKCRNCGFNITVPSVFKHSRVSIAAHESANQTVDGSERGYEEKGVLEGQNSNATCPLEMLVEDCWLIILDRLSDQDTVYMYASSSEYSHVKEVVKNHNLVIRRQLVCFYLRKMFTEAVLGIGLSVDIPHWNAFRLTISNRPPTLLGGASATVRVLDRSHG